MSTGPDRRRGAVGVAAGWGLGLLLPMIIFSFVATLASERASRCAP
ncbi:hypothetical protein [Streptomyces sp. MMG1121]|nr:hypothetical protein [Streptomyces sp. MMG1121]